MFATVRAEAHGKSRVKNASATRVTRRKCVIIEDFEREQRHQVVPFHIARITFHFHLPAEPVNYGGLQGQK